MKAKLLLLLCLIIGLYTNAQTYSFIKNIGQWEAPFDYKCDIPDGAMFMSKNKITYSLYNGAQREAVHEARHDIPEKDIIARAKLKESKIDCYAYSITFKGANENVFVQTLNKKKEHHNYFLGNNSALWKSKVPLFENLMYKNLYDGIDYSIYTNSSNQLKYDFIVAPNKNVTQIQLEYNGIKPTITKDGKLLIKTTFSEIVELAPIAYQIVNNHKAEVPCKYILKNNVLQFAFPEGYNKNIELVIDPVMVFQTYSGSSSTTYGWSATFDYKQRLLSGGESFGAGWPTFVGSFQTTFGGSVDVGINTYSADGTTLVHSSYFGGSNSDEPSSMVCNKRNELFIVGQTSSTNMPTTPGCWDNTNNGGQDIFVVHFDSTLSTIIGSTYLGGTSSDGHSAHGAICDNLGNIAIGSVTYSNNYPTTPGAYQTTNNGNDAGVFTFMDSNCTTLIGSTYLSGTTTNASTIIYGMEYMQSGEFLVSGNTDNTSNFPITAGTYTNTNAAGGFVAKFNATGTTLIGSTYVGPGINIAKQVRTDLANNIYVYGSISNTLVYPITPGAYVNAGGNLAVQKLTNNLSNLMISTKVGEPTGGGSFGSGGQPIGFMIDSCNYIYMSALGANSNNPLTANAHQTTPGSFYLCVLTPGMLNLHYATFMGALGDHIDGGGSRFDPFGTVYHSVCTSSPTAYASATSYSPTKVSPSWDVASFKFDFEVAKSNGNFVIGPQDSICIPSISTFTHFDNGTTIFEWDFGDGSPLFYGSNPTHTYSIPGVYDITLIITDTNTFACVISDTIRKSIHVYLPTNAQFTHTQSTSCDMDSVFAEAPLGNPIGTIYTWRVNGLQVGTQPNLNYIFNTPGTYTLQLVTKNVVCSDTATTIITVLPKLILNAFVNPDSVCIGTPVIFSNTSTGNGLTSGWIFGDGTFANNNNPTNPHTYSQPGVYTAILILGDIKGCIDSFKKTIFIDGPINNTLTTTQPLLCETDSVQFTNILSPAVTSFTYDFADGTSLTNVSNPKHEFNTPGVYNVTLTTNYRKCPSQVYSAPIQVFEFPAIELGPEQNICPGLETVTINGPNVPGWTYQWNTGETQPNIVASKLGWYKLAIKNGACTSVDSVQVVGNIKCTSVPNAFTPNGDGINDYFLPIMVNPEASIDFKFAIFNRWGQEVYVSFNAFDKGWDGTFKGQPLDMETFFFTFDVADKWGNKKSFQGDVLLMR